MDINILGTMYDFSRAKRDDDPTLEDADGYCNAFAKRIVVVQDGFRAESSDTEESMQALVNKIKRHEIVHAFFAESGLREYCNNEELVDWIAWHFPKMLEAFNQAQAL